MLGAVEFIGIFFYFVEIELTSTFFNNEHNKPVTIIYLPHSLTIY